MSERASVEVIIPAYNEEKIIEACLKSLLSQSYENFVVTIIDDASVDRTAAIVKSFAEKHPKRLRLRQWGKLGPGRARNRAAQESQAEILAFMDADCEAFPNWIEELVKAFEQSSFDSVGGPQLAHPKSNSFQQAIERFFRSMAWLISFYKRSRDSSEIFETDHNPLCNVAYRKGVFLKLEGFREDLFPGEDYEFDWRLRRSGGKIAYHSLARVYHHRPETLAQFDKVMFAYGRAQGKLFRERGPHRLLHWVGLILPGLFICTALILAIFKIWWALFSILILGFSLLFFRPQRGPLFLQIFLAGFSWFKGFFYGFWTKSAPPPGSPKGG
ncbi:MAG: glycosyltransferase [Bradymonadales bacterium]|nr:MAG: glycosyltransferase [Bradymonadales bacterium]